MMVLSKIVKAIIKDGKDRIVFRNKLIFRTESFPPHHSKNEIINMSEILVQDDPEYGKYFCRLEKCNMCEMEADVRQKAN